MKKGEIKKMMIQVILIIIERVAVGAILFLQPSRAFP